MKIARLATLVFGIALCLCISLARAPGLYDGLWEDEVHYHAPVFLSPTLSSFRADIGPIMKPFLEFALRKWLWFSRFGFSVFEQRLALVSLLYSSLHLLAWMILPWTPYMGLQVMAVLLLGSCSVESTYSTEAQGYSFYSFAPTIMFLGFMWSCRHLKQKKPTMALAVFLFATAVYLNSHFFAWPSCLLWVALFSAYVEFDETLERSQKNRILGALLGGFGVTLGLTLVADKPGLYYLLFQTPSPRAGFHADWKGAFGYLSEAWKWLNIPGGVFLLIAGASLAHPRRIKRYAAWAAILTFTLAKYILILLMTMSSSYGIANRYQIMFIAPAILAFALGIESIAEWFESYAPRSGSLFIMAALSFVLFRVGGPFLSNLIPRAKQGVSQMRQTSPNYSANYYFFEQVKDYKSPILVLTNHCWGSDIPRLYISRIGKPITTPAIVLNTSGHCETSPSTLSSEMHRFMSSYQENGKVVFFYEGNADTLVPCGLGSHVIYRRREGACVGIIPAKTAAPVLFPSGKDRSVS